MDQDGYLDKLKVRMCVRGDIQKKLTEDMEDTHSPAAAHRMLKKFAGLAAQKRSNIHQGYVIGAFLQALMCSRVLVIIDRYYGVFFPEFADYCGKPLLLKKAMYGMTLSGKYWYQVLMEFLISIGFIQSTVIKCLFFKKLTDGSVIFLLNYVDDMLYYGSSDDALLTFEIQLSERFNLETKG